MQYIFKGSPANQFLFITDCTMELNVTYDLGKGMYQSYRESGIYTTAEACRTYCQCDHDALIFAWGGGTCTCFASDEGRQERFIYGHGGDVSGLARGCGGACEWLKSRLPDDKI